MSQDIPSPDSGDQVNTLDPIATAPSGGLVSPAADRNAAAILGVLKAHLPADGRVLEIASGSGQHAVAFAAALPGIDWTPSDPSPEARASIAAWTSRDDLPNLKPAIALDAALPDTWPKTEGCACFDAIVCINMIHISPWSATEGLMDGAVHTLANPGGLLVLYGPYLESDVPLTASNRSFDDSLRLRNPAWGLRDRDRVVALARTRGLHLTQRIAMPANNIMLLFRRV